MMLDGSAITVTVLLAAMSTAAEPTEVYKVVPRLATGQELTYRGKITQTSVGDHGVRYEHRTDVDCVALVLDVDTESTAKVGCLTVQRRPVNTTRDERDALEDVIGLHLAALYVAPNGKPTWLESGADLGIAPEGVAPWVLSYFMEMPKERIGVGSQWTIQRPGQTPTFAKCTAEETRVGKHCLQIVTTQKSRNWDVAEIDRTAWRHTSTLWVQVDSGIVHDVETVHSIRSPRSPQAERTITTVYDLRTDLRYRGPLFTEREEDYRTAYRLQSELEGAMAGTPVERRAALRKLQVEVSTIGKGRNVTPYQPVIARLVEQVAAASEAVTQEPDVPFYRSNPKATVGKKARNFVVKQVSNGESIKLSTLKGTPVVLVFVDPKADISLYALKSVVETQSAIAADVRILAVCSSVDDDTQRRLDLYAPGDYTVCTGGGVEKSYGIDGLPHTLFIDGDGILRVSYPGFGPEGKQLLAASLGDYSTTKLGQRPGSSTQR